MGRNRAILGGDDRLIDDRGHGRYRLTERASVASEHPRGGKSRN